MVSLGSATIRRAPVSLTALSMFRPKTGWVEVISLSTTSIVLAESGESKSIGRACRPMVLETASCDLA